MIEAAPIARADVGLAAALFAIDPVGLGGVAVRAPFGPAREIFLSRLLALIPPATPVRRLPAGVDDERLLGGLDLAASLAAGRPLAARGLLSEVDGGILIAPMAERLDAGLAGRLTAAIDLGEAIMAREGVFARRPARFGLVLLDEGAAPEERPPEALIDRIAFIIEDEALEEAARPGAELGPDGTAVARARETITDVEAPEALIEALCAAAYGLGLRSMRTPLFALRAARAHAALYGRRVIAPEDASAGARLVLRIRAEADQEGEDAPKDLEEPSDPQAPPSAADAPPTPPETAPDATSETSDAKTPTSEALDAQADLLVDAVRAAIPGALLDAALAKSRSGAGRGRGRGGGGRESAKTRGRPAGSRPGPLARGARLDLVATLKAAAPFQRLRGGGVGPGPLKVGKEDFRIRRFAAKPETTAVFAVDASGSSALQRLGEVKGAVERLLADAYISRTRVALIAFRDQGADLLLAPTRSLTRAKRRLSELPGGGGTPLGAGIAAALDVALDERSRSRRPMIVVLTDGRANVSRSGVPGRAAAEADAIAAARQVAASGIDAVFVDTAPRPGPDAERFARAMGARYTALPFADAEQLSKMVSSLRKDGP